jgi:hypothetical protein
VIIPEIKTLAAVLGAIRHFNILDAINVAIPTFRAQYRKFLSNAHSVFNANKQRLEITTAFDGVIANVNDDDVELWSQLRITIVAQLMAGLG